MSEMTKTQAAPQDDILLEVRNLKKYRNNFLRHNKRLILLKDFYKHKI